jgi:hypothetical protein
VFSAITCSVVLLGMLAAPPKDETWFAPGKRTTLLAHNAFPDGNKWTDRLDRALSAGTPSMIEIDLIWKKDSKTGQFRSYVSRPESFTGEELDMNHYFFPKVRPMVEKALKAGNRKDWPLIVLFLDIKDNAPEHVQELWNKAGEYEGWLTTAVKTSDPAKPSPLDLKPLMIVVNDKADSTQEECFYNRLPVGGKLRIFGAAKTYSPPRSGKKGQPPSVDLSEIDPAKYFLEPAGNYRRWVARPWNLIEKGGVAKAGDWTPAEEQRLAAFATQAHKLGYLIGFYHLNGHAPDAGKGWEEESNFGSLERAKIRWTAALKAGVDLISTDQYEEVAALIRKNGSAGRLETGIQ